MAFVSKFPQIRLLSFWYEWKNLRGQKEYIHSELDTQSFHFFFFPPSVRHSQYSGSFSFLIFPASLHCQDFKSWKSRDYQLLRWQSLALWIKWGWIKNQCLFFLLLLEDKRATLGANATESAQVLYVLSRLTYVFQPKMSTKSKSK